MWIRAVAGFLAGAYRAIHAAGSCLLQNPRR
jgi:hypothetical protein